MNKVKGITVEINANIDPFKKALEELRQEMEMIDEDTKPKGVYIFKCNTKLNDTGYELLRDEIAEQIKNGVVMLKSDIDFVEYIGEDEGEELFVVHADKKKNRDKKYFCF